jgi:hypothetical protein
VSTSETYELIDAPLEPPPPGERDEPKDHFYRHVIHGVAILDAIAAEYRVLLPAWQSGSPVPRPVVLELAGTVAAVIQSALRRAEVFQSAPEAEFRPMQLIGALEQLLYSLVLLTDDPEAVGELPLAVEELDDLFEAAIIRDALADGPG